jgi:hypothetical protein
MSSLSEFARGGTVASGPSPTSADSPGSHQGASSSLLPTLAPTDALRALEVSGGEYDLLGTPSLTTGGISRANYAYVHTTSVG